MADAQSLRDRLKEHMRENRLKSTRQRSVIFETFVEVGDHVSIDELLARVQRQLPGVGYATVYRTLKLLSEAGVAHERRFGDGQTRYEPAHLDEHHDHLICVTCGHIFEFEDEVIELRQARVAASHGLRIVAHTHSIHGECEAPESCTFRLEQEAKVL